MLVLLFSYAAKAQPDILNISLTDSTKNILFVGVDNRLLLKNISLTQGSLSIRNGVLVTKLAKEFVARVNSDSTKAVITFTKKNKVVFSKEFEIASIPDPVARLGYIPDSIASIGQILANPYLTSGCNCYLNYPVYIISFKLSINKVQGDEYGGFATGNKLTGEQIKQIRECSSGDKLVFTDIRALGPDSRTRKLPDFTITIK